MEQKISSKDILKFSGMVIGTGISGLVVGFGVGYLLAVLMRNQFEGWGGLVGAIIGLFIFYPAGVVLGQVICKQWHYRGSLILGIAGVFAGAFSTIGLTYLLHININSNLLLGSFFVLTPLLGTAGYHLGRKKTQASPQTV